MLIGSTSFANNSINNDVQISDIETTNIEVNDFGVCTYTIARTTMDSDGEFQTEYKTYRRYAVSQSDCNSLADTHVDYLNQGMPW